MARSKRSATLKSFPDRASSGPTVALLRKDQRIIQFKGNKSGIMKVTGFREQILDRTHAIKLFFCPPLPVAKHDHVRFITKQVPKRERLTDESSPPPTEPMLN